MDGFGVFGLGFGLWGFGLGVGVWAFWLVGLLGIGELGFGLVRI